MNGRNANTATQHDLLHIRVAPILLDGIDALAMAWGTNRTAAANRLLDEGVTRHIDEALTVLQSLADHYQQPRAATRTEGAT